MSPLNFDGFYYDLDNDARSESISITLGNPDNRTIHENDLKYSTTVSNIPFTYRPFGNYNVIGFLGERYFAGYTNNTKFTRTPVNLLNHGLLLGILMDENMGHALTPGSALALRDGYAIWVENVNIDEGTTLISLKKNGEKIETRTVKAGETYVYKKNTGKVKSINGDRYDENIAMNNLPIIAIKTDPVIIKEDIPAITVKGIFQLSDTYTKIEIPFDYLIYGRIKVTTVSDTGILMENMEPLNLRYPYSTEYNFDSLPITRTIGIKVADSGILRFHLENDPFFYENHERRGAVYTESNPVLTWDGLNFAGFQYDLDSGDYSEILEITNLSGRTIPANSLRYTAFVTEIPFDVTKKTGLKPSGTNSSYKGVSFGGNKYVAIKANSRLLAQVLLDNGTSYLGKKTLVDRETWTIGEGYSLTVKSIYTGLTPRQACFVLSKKGALLDEECLSPGDIYSYPTMNLSEENDLPLFITYLDAVFSGSTFDLIQVRYSWLRSSNVTELKKGDSYGIFRVTSVETGLIELKNDRDIDLSPGSCIHLIGNLSFIVADSEELRFYPSRGKKCDR